jgi:superoxide dismutase, Cu-Zn family
VRTMISLGMLLLAASAACGNDSDDGAEAAGLTADAVIEPRSSNTTLAGNAQFSGAAGAISLTLKLTGAPPGQHGVHIHETGNCSAPDATSAGGHWNPTTKMHGAPGAAAHLGDLGNVTVAADGTVTLTYSNPAWTLGDGAPTDVIGKAIVVHEKVDDLMTQPTGDAGGRIGCGVIE